MEAIPVDHPVSDDQEDTSQGRDRDPGHEAAKKEEGDQNSHPFDESGDPAFAPAADVDKGGTYRSGSWYATDQS